jgi:hypothetical protein
MSLKSPTPERITDLVDLKRKGFEVTCEPVFEIILVDFTQQNFAYQAYVFLCRYVGSVNGESYAFRKCYARGCPNNLCPHVFQAVMIANHYLSRDYERLKACGIKVPNQEFSLEEMMVKFDSAKEEFGPPVTIDDYIRIAGEGNAVRIGISLEYLPAVEHFTNYKNEQTFLNGDFKIQTLAKTGICQRCLACYTTNREKEEKPQAVRIANQRLAILYQEFDKVSIQYEKAFF